MTRLGSELDLLSVHADIRERVHHTRAGPDCRTDFSRAPQETVVAYPWPGDRERSLRTRSLSRVVFCGSESHASKVFHVPDYKPPLFMS